MPDLWPAPVITKTMFRMVQYSAYRIPIGPPSGGYALTGINSKLMMCGVRPYMAKTRDLAPAFMDAATAGTRRLVTTVATAAETPAFLATMVELGRGVLRGVYGRNFGKPWCLRRNTRGLGKGLWGVHGKSFLKLNAIGVTGWNTGSGSGVYGYSENWPSPLWQRAHPGYPIEAMGYVAE